MRDFVDVRNVMAKQNIKELKMMNWILEKRCIKNFREVVNKEKKMMTEEILINNKEQREKLIQRIDVLEKVKTLLLIPNTEFATVKQVAEFYEVDESVIQKLYQRNNDELIQDGVCNKKSKDFLDWTKCPSQRGSVKMLFSNGDIVVIPNSGTKVFPRRAILRVGMLLRDSVIAKEVRTQLLNIEGKTSNEAKSSSIDEEEKLLMGIALAYKSGEIDKLMAATSAYNQFQSRYIRELEPKARIVDEMINNNSSVTTTITQRIKDTDATKKWKREIKNRELGKTTLLVLNFVHDFINENGFSPTVREIGEAVGLKSTSSVQAHMDKLDSLGYLVKDHKKTRNIRVNEEKYLVVMK